jgi:hypothetical protein
MIKMDHRTLLNAEAALRVLEASLDLPTEIRVHSKQSRLAPGRLQ